MEKAELTNDELVQMHLVNFCSSFIRREFRERWLYNLEKRPDKVKKEFHKLYKVLDLRFCKHQKLSWLDVGALIEQSGRKRGVFFSAKLQKPQLASLEDAVQSLDPYLDDAILSIVPGSVALAFSHDGDMWSCFRQ